MSSSENAVKQLNETLEGFKTKVDVKIENVNQATNSIKQTTDRIYDRVNKFKNEMILNEEKQIAHENIIRIDQLIREKFINYVEVRRTVMGVVKDFDINLIRNSTIEELSEELWMTSSRYWLSYALIAITAWVNDQPDIANNAVSESFRKDPVKTSLFFCLMNIRFNRIPTAKRWFFEYMKTLDPTQIQSETAIIIQAYVNGLFGKDKELEFEVQQVIDNWVMEINLNEDISTEIVDSFKNYLVNLKSKKEFNFKTIKSHCSNYDNVMLAYLESAKYNDLIDLVKAVDVELVNQTNANYKVRVDAVLEDLINNYDKDEVELRKQKEYYQMIVKNDGDTEFAKKQYTEMMDVRDSGYNIGKQMVNWALYDADADEQVRKFSFQNTKVWFLGALNDWSSSFESKNPTQFAIQIGSFKSISNGDDEREQLEAMKESFEKHKFGIKYANVLNIILLLLAALGVVGGLQLSPFSYIATGVFGVLLITRICLAEKKYKDQLKQQQQVLRLLMTELAEAKRQIEENKALKTELYSLIEHLQEELIMKNEENLIQINDKLEKNIMKNLVKADDDEKTTDLSNEKLKEMNKKLPAWSLEPPFSFFK